MSMKYAALTSLSAAALLVGGMGVAQAISFGDHSYGPIELNGYVTVDNTGEPGGTVTDFACKIVGYGRIDPWFPNYSLPPTTAFGPTNIIWIEGLQARHRSSGQQPEGCNMVRFYNLPWAVTIGGTVAAPTVTIPNVAFQAPLNPGCGDPGATGPVTGPAGITWSEGGHYGETSPAPTFPAGDPVYSTLSFNDVVILSNDGDCILNGIIKITRPHAPYLVP